MFMPLHIMHIMGAGKFVKSTGGDFGMCISQCGPGQSSWQGARNEVLRS